MPPHWLDLATTEAAAHEAARLGVSRVARSRRGFLPRYRAARGSPDALTDYWRDRRNAFVARHMAQVRARREPLWRDGAPTRRHLALAVWAYSPTPGRLRRWLRSR